MAGSSCGSRGYEGCVIQSRPSEGAPGKRSPGGLSMDVELGYSEACHRPVRGCIRGR